MTNNITVTKRERRAQKLADLVAERKAFETELAAKRAAIEAEAEAEKKALDEAFQRAGRARTAAVEELYEVFGIDEDVVVSTTKGGTERRTRKDRDETKRAARLVEAVVALVAEHGLPVEAEAEAAETAAEAGIELPREAVLETVGEATDDTDPEDAEGDGEDIEEDAEDPHERGFRPFG